MESRFLGLNFPNTDIPVQARILFTKNRFRIIDDVHATTAVIVPQTRDIDLTYSILRASSPIHLLYLKNMGVRASLTISIVVGAKKKVRNSFSIVIFHLTKQPYSYGV